MGYTFPTLFDCRGDASLQGSYMKNSLMAVRRAM